MPLQFLRDLPQEIREEIYSYLLVSPSGYVTTLPPGPWIYQILPWDMRQEITLNSHAGSRNLDLSLLQVSRQVNRECKDILWRRNIVLFKPYEIYLHNTRLLTKNPGPLAAAKHVAVPIDLTAACDIEATVEALRCLEGWSKKGSLEKITVIAVNERQRPFVERDPKIEQLKTFKSSLEKVTRFRVGAWSENERGYYDPEASERAKACFEEYLCTLRAAGNGYLAHLQRKLVVNTNFGRLSFQEQQKYVREALMDPNELMLELHEAFGGELWIDGELCYKAGIQIKQRFKAGLNDNFTCPLEAERPAFRTTVLDARISIVQKGIGTSCRTSQTSITGGQVMEQQYPISEVLK